MGSALPKLDVSVTDHRWQCSSCGYRHDPAAFCVTPGVWLGQALSVDARRRRRAEEAAVDE